MAFSDFKTVAEVQEKFRIRYVLADFVDAEATITPSTEFLREFEFNKQYLNIFRSEATRCETIIFPILREIYKRYADNYVLWSHESIGYDETLNATPDYFIATKSEMGLSVVGTPILMLVEAKKNDFERGWAQCLAELVAAKKINDDATFPIYGIVTDGIFWQFGRLVCDTFTQNLTPFSFTDLPRLFGVIDTFFKTGQRSKIKK